MMCMLFISGCYLMLSLIRVCSSDCPAEMCVPGAQTNYEISEVSPNVVVVDFLLKFEADAWVTSISAYITRASGHVTFGIFKLIGDISTCPFEVVDTWRAENLNEIGWQTFEIPPNEYLRAKKDHYFGFFDPVTNGQGAVGYKLDGSTDRICTTGHHNDLTVGDTFSLAWPRNRDYTIQVCYRPDTDFSGFHLKAGWSLDGYDLTSLDACSIFECGLQCLRHHACRSFLFASGASTVDQKCLLKSQTHVGVGTMFHTDVDWDYWELIYNHNWND